MGEEVKAHGVPIYTDARLYSTAGIPTVLYGAGPHTLLEANGHRADEKLKLDDLFKATRVVALALSECLRPNRPVRRGDKTTPALPAPRRRRRPEA
jgi:acetylornithine deacetylase/succinyl-diaminopimelate desuccinylase-like protein